MKQQITKDQEICPSCGGQLAREDQNTFQCTSCGRKFYQSSSRTHSISVHLPMGKMIFICLVAAMVMIAVAVGGYQYYTGRLVRSASRFSVVFRDFLMEAYGKPVAEIGAEDLEEIRYLKIEKDGDYRFTYSSQDVFDDPDKIAEAKVITVSGSKEDFSPSNIQYFTGLTQLELYTDAWENYVLPEENQLRCIYCVDGLSRSGTPEFFSAANPDTLEDVVILKAGQLTDFSFMKDLRGIKRFALEGASLNDVSMFDGFGRLEELSLYYVEMEEEKAYDMIRSLLDLPSLRLFWIEGKTAWYLTDEQWEKLKQDYGGRVMLVRK